ncbi:ATP-binding protein [Alysiella filiformis]|uniref:Chemotaxis protein CheA n=1 Tax=Alysiella filiformis DSM 16848 TaxID=1120981 RepID=A0A286E3X9_9NEIS|nr:ATP-binding protein [Alysiella filiformis]QMT31041.1 Hpt domain-containing protein [Alysiella filiformis]UBQ55968.1 Hpt domain-containing protein [Alysiella filiformis DSM 16848]SOD65606.1 Hpt domain-containing protein [Alysiella filiformis DSM 16848]
MKTKNSATGLKKYRGLLILIGLFLLLTVGMLIANFISTRYFTQQSQVTSLATQQGVFIQQMSKNLMDVDLYIQQQIHEEEHEHANQSAAQQHEAGVIELSELPQDGLNRISEIKTLKDNFEQSLQAFEKGGEFQGVQVPALSGKAKQHAERIREIWNPYLGLIDNFIEDTQSNKISAKTSTYLVDYTRLYNQTLLNESQAMTNILNAHVVYRSDIVQMITLAALIGAFLLFGLIVFGSFGQLLKGDALLERANQEMGEIMSSVREGLFLIDKEFVIGNEYSANLEELIGSKNLGGKSFLDVAESLLPESEIETLQVFVEQLYSEWVMEDLIEDLNPLHRIVVTQSNGQPRYLDFRFFRVTQNEKIERVLVNVVDSTQAVLLQASLEAQQEQEKREMEMLNTILNTDAGILAGFIQVTKQRLTEINESLKSEETGQMELRAKVNFIGRAIHGIKGESSSLRLRRMVDICENVEDNLGVLRNQSSLNGQDFLGLVVLLEDLYRLTDILDNYSQRMNGGSGESVKNAVQQPEKGSSGSQNPMQARLAHLQKFVQDIAKREHKQANLTVQGFEKAQFDNAKWQPIQDILVQILRNSVVHGIEPQNVRQARQKSAIGELKLSFSEDKNFYHLTAEDDGNGINFDAIRAKAVEQGQYSPAQVAQLSRNQLLALMMSDGFSTLDHASEDAGKGVGMGIIKESVKQMGGKMNVASAFEQYTRFTFSFPKK